jgi:hypothetical protein
MVRVRARLGLTLPKLLPYPCSTSTRTLTLEPSDYQDVTSRRFDIRRNDFWRNDNCRRNEMQRVHVLSSPSRVRVLHVSSRVRVRVLLGRTRVRVQQVSSLSQVFIIIHLQVVISANHLLKMNVPRHYRFSISKFFY